MAKSSISKDDVYAAALAVQKAGELPTTINVRAKLGGHGSQTTIHKHLTRWKKLYANDDGQSMDELRVQLLQQQSINANLSAELLKSRELVETVSAQNAQLQARALELEVRVEEKILANQALAQRNIQSEARLKDSFDAMVAILSEQLHAINVQAMQKVQEIGHLQDEKIIAGRLQLRTLQEQLELKEQAIKKLQATQFSRAALASSEEPYL